MKYKLIAVDMDGTLLNDEQKITERTKIAIVKAVETGALFVTATGRSIMGAGLINELFEQDMPFIVFNGASAVMGKSKEILFSKFLDTDTANEVYDIGKSRGMPMVVWTNKGLRAHYGGEESEVYRKYFHKYYYNDQKEIDEFSEIAHEQVYKIIWFGPRETVNKYHIEMGKHFENRANCHPSLPEYLEFVSPEADKGIAMGELGKIYGIDKSEMIAVGDGYNDVSMLKYAGLGIAMENAPDEIKAVCGEVTLSNNDDGVAAVIEKYIL